MTAPGQEPDEIMTATPGGEDEAVARPDLHTRDEPDLDAIGDNHMPEDVRESVRDSAAEPEGTEPDTA